MTNLTPHDRGNFLKPHPWPLPREDHHGIVDFDDKEDGTIFTVLARPCDAGNGHLLSVSTYTSHLSTEVEVNGDCVLVLDEDMFVGLQELADIAEHGLDVFWEQAARGKFSAVVIAKARERWKLVETTLNRLRLIRKETSKPKINQ